MIHRQAPVLVLLALAACTSRSRAQEIVYYEENGVTYRETRQTIRCPVAETKIQECEQTVYRPQWKTETRDVVRTYQVPVTEYRWEAYWQGRFNPFVQPYLAQRLVPRTRWETRTETVKVPTTSYSVVPEKSVVRTPVTTWKTIERQVTARVPVAGRIVASAGEAISPRGTAPTQAASAIDAGQSIGGVARLDADPPRQGSNLGWRAAGATTIR
jgi:hypothetical protein